MKSVIIIAIAFVLLIPSTALSSSDVEICGDKICGEEDNWESLTNDTVYRMNCNQYYTLDLHPTGIKDGHAYFIDEPMIWRLVQVDHPEGVVFYNEGINEIGWGGIPQWLLQTAQWYDERKISCNELQNALGFIFEMYEEEYCIVDQDDCNLRTERIEIEPVVLPISLTKDKSNYQINETVSISGVVNELFVGHSLTAGLYDSRGEFIDGKTIDVNDDDGYFFIDILITDEWKSGIYQVIVDYGNYGLGEIISADTWFVVD